MNGCPTPSARLLRAMKTHFGAASIDVAWECVHHGKWCNANVYRMEIGGRVMILKEFDSCPALARATIGRFLVLREAKVLARLAEAPGVPTGVRRVVPYALVMDYIPGRVLSELRPEIEKLPKTFFEEMEKRLSGLHERGVVHLDLRNMGNLLLGDDAKPYIIDFQSSLHVKYLPSAVRRKLQDIDFSGVYKGWSRFCAEELDGPRSLRVVSVEARRRLWIFKGYWLSKTLSRVGRIHAAAISHLIRSKSHDAGLVLSRRHRDGRQ